MRWSPAASPVRMAQRCAIDAAHAQDMSATRATTTARVRLYVRPPYPNGDSGDHIGANAGNDDLNTVGAGDLGSGLGRGSGFVGAARGWGIAASVP